MLVNINRYVWVRLTDKGRILLDEHDRRLLEVIKSLKKLPERREKDGWTQFQLWELMEIFGPYMGHGVEQPFEAHIELDEVGE